MLRRLIDDYKESPATMTFCTLWVVVFALMVLDQMRQGSVPTLNKLVLGVQGGGPFGELKPRDLFEGEVWRPLTATFVHYGLLHIGMNLFMMYQLGGMVESWYGSWQFVAVYVAIGYGGNFLAAVARYALGSNPSVASGGGSTVVLGLAAVCAVVGWRSRTRVGDHLRGQMVGLLVITALIGQVAPIIDNWGHAGGALIGTMIGFAHRTLIKTAHRPMARWSGGLGLLILVACGAAQVQDDRVDSIERDRARRQWQAEVESALADYRKAMDACVALPKLWEFYWLAARRSRYDHEAILPESVRQARTGPPRVPGATATPAGDALSLWESSDEDFRDALERRIEWLDKLRPALGVRPDDADFTRLRTILKQVLDRPPPDRIVSEFLEHLKALTRLAQDRMRHAGERLQSLQARSG